MTWQSGTCNDYIELLQNLVQIATSRHLDAISINAAGTGYVAGDLLGITNTGSTRTHDAQLEVLTVGGGGSITSARISMGGAYTVDPTTTTGNAATGGTGTGATFNLTFDDTGWSVQRRSRQAVSATVGAGGSGGTNGTQTVTVVGGVGVTTAAQFSVTVSGGAITAVLGLVTAGLYEEEPTPNPVSVTGAGLTGATLNVTWTDAITQGNGQLAILKGTAAGALDPYVAVRLWDGSNIAANATTKNWALFGMTSFNASVPLHQQANVSPGLTGAGAIATGNIGVFVALKDSDAFDITYWISARERRIIVYARVQSASTDFYVSCYMGLANPLGTASEFSYPLVIAGTTNRNTAWYRDTNAVLSGLTEMAYRTTGGGAYLWYPEGTSWITLRNAGLSADTSLTPTPGTGSDENGTYPAFRGTAVSSVEDQITSHTSGVFNWSDIIFEDGAGAIGVFRSPMTGGNLAPLFPVVVLRTDQDAAPDVYSQIGELDGVFWTSAAEGQSSQDDVLIGTTRYRIFQNGNRVQDYSFCAIRED